MTTKTKIIIASSAVVVTALAIFINYRSRKIKRIAKSFEGVKEIGKNSGFTNETLENMLRESGWKGGEAWCMYYVKAIYKKALPNLADKIQKEFSGSTQRAWNDVANGKSELFETITSGRPKVGDIVIWQRTNDSSKGHAAIVIKPNSSKFENGYTTIEGNANYQPSFQGEGDMVDEVQHDLKYGSTNTTYKGLWLRGFLRLK